MTKFNAHIFRLNITVSFFLLPLLLHSQILKTYSYAGFSINLSSKWVLKSESTVNSPLFAFLKPSNVYLGISLTKIPSGSNPIISNSEASKIKPEMMAALKQRGVIISKFSLIASTFLNKKCFQTKAIIKDPEYLNGIVQYYNTIQFIHNGYLFNIVSNIPVSNNSLKEIDFINKQLETIIFF